MLVGNENYEILYCTVQYTSIVEYCLLRTQLLLLLLLTTRAGLKRAESSRVERTLKDRVDGGLDGAQELGALVPVVLAPHGVHARALEHEAHDRHVERRPIACKRGGRTFLFCTLLYTAKYILFKSRGDEER